MPQPYRVCKVYIRRRSGTVTLSFGSNLGGPFRNVSIAGFAKGRRMTGLDCVDPSKVGRERGDVGGGSLFFDNRDLPVAPNEGCRNSFYRQSIMRKGFDGTDRLGRERHRFKWGRGFSTQDRQNRVTCGCPLPKDGGSVQVDVWHVHIAAPKLASLHSDAHGTLESCLYLATVGGRCALAYFDNRGLQAVVGFTEVSFVVVDEWRAREVLRAERAGIEILPFTRARDPRHALTNPRLASAPKPPQMISHLCGGLGLHIREGAGQQFIDGSEVEARQ